MNTLSSTKVHASYDHGSMFSIFALPMFLYITENKDKKQKVKIKNTNLLFLDGSRFWHLLLLLLFFGFGLEKLEAQVCFLNQLTP